MITSYKKLLTKLDYKRARPVHTFVVVAAVFGLSFLVVTPPFQTPDEPVHFLRAYQVSRGNFVVDTLPKGVGGSLPSSLGVLISKTSNLPFHAEQKYNVRTIKDQLRIKEEVAHKKFYDLSATLYYTPISYLPQSTGIFIARVFHAPPILMAYMGRFMNLITWIVLMGLAIRFMPYKKWALVFIGLLPMALFEAVSLSADVMTYGLLALVLSLVLRFYAHRSLITNKQLLLLAALLSALVLTKQVMFVLTPLVLLLPAISLGGRKRAIYKKALLIATPLLIYGAWMLVVTDIKIASPPPFYPSPPDQISFILHRPLSYVDTVWKTYFLTNSDGITRSFIGDFGWLDTPLSEAISVFGYLCLFFLLVANYKPAKMKLKKAEKYLLVGLAAAYILVITTAMYVYYDPVKFTSVIGLQGRYYIPVAMLAIPILYSDWLKTLKKHYLRVAIFAPVILLSASILTMFYRFYSFLP